MRAHDLLREVDRYVSSVVDILQGHSYFDFESRSLLLLFFLPPKEVSEDVKWVMMLHPIVLEAIKAMSVVLLALFLVGQNLVGCFRGSGYRRLFLKTFRSQKDHLGCGQDGTAETACDTPF